MTPAERFPGSGLRSLAADLFSELRRISFDGVGITRASFAPVETAAQELIARVAAENGLASNLIPPSTWSSTISCLRRAC